MKQNKANNKSYSCEFCGSENQIPAQLSNYLLEGNHTLEGEHTAIQKGDQAPKLKRYRFFCQQCGRPNEKWV